MADIDMDISPLQKAVLSNVSTTGLAMASVQRAFDPLKPLKGSRLCGPSPAGEVLNVHFDNTSGAILTILTELQGSLAALHEAMLDAAKLTDASQEQAAVEYKLASVQRHAETASSTYTPPAPGAAAPASAATGAQTGAPAGAAPAGAATPGATS